MSDLPPPPPPAGGGAVPPPPPPGLHATPSYAPSPYATATAPLKRIGGLTKAVIALTGVAGAIAVLTVIAAEVVAPDAEEFLAGSTTDEEFLEAAIPWVLASFLQGVAVVATAVVVMIWMFRMAANHRALHRTGTWGPGWAIGGWFLPPLLYIIPFLMFRELWRASDPSVPAHGDWRAGPASPLLTVWFVLYSIVPILLLFTQTSETFASINADETDLAESLTGSQWPSVLGALAALAAATVFIAVARRLAARHRRLTGEN